MQVQEDPRAGIAWVSGEGQLYCVSKGFMALLGYSFRDMQRKIQAIGEAQLFVCLFVCPSVRQSVRKTSAKVEVVICPALLTPSSILQELMMTWNNRWSLPIRNVHSSLTL